LRERLEDILSIIKEAGEILKEGFGKNKEVVFKGEIDLVTQYDTACEKYLCDRFGVLFPEFQIVAEESYKNESLSDKLIIIDPIDGTTNFVHNIPHVAISVAFIDKGAKSIGVVYNPILNEMFIGIEGEGATLNGKKIEIKKGKELNKSLVATGFPYKIIEDSNTRAKIIALMDKVLGSVRGIRRLGAASLDLCYLACGRFDIFYEYDLKPWDVAAGIIILEEAGGIALNRDKQKYDIFNDDLIISSNKELAEIFIKLLQ